MGANQPAAVSGNHASLRTDFRRPVHCILGLPFDAVSMNEVMRRIGSASVSRRCFLSTPNLNFLIASQSNAAFRDSVIRSDLSVADGMPLVWIASLLGIPIRERVAGSDVFEALARDGETKLKVFFFGGTPHVAEQACNRLNGMPESNLRCVGYASPGFGSIEEMSDPEMIEQINRSGADFVVVSLGAAKGQAWIEHNREALNAPVISHLGAVVKFVAGTVSRAPFLVQKLGLEWLWRIKEEPVLYRRYAVDAFALLRLLVTHILPGMTYRMLGVLPKKNTPPRAIVDDSGSPTRLTLSGSWFKEDLPLLQRTLETATVALVDIDVDVSDLGRIDDAFLGTLMLLYGHQSRVGRGFRVLSVIPAVRRVFRMHCAEFLLNGLDRSQGTPAN